MLYFASFAAEASASVNDFLLSLVTSVVGLFLLFFCSIFLSFGFIQLNNANNISAVGSVSCTFS